MTTLEKIGNFWETNNTVKRAIIMFCSCFGVGQFSLILGNVLSGLLGFLIFFVTKNLASYQQYLALLFFALLAVLASNRYEKIQNTQNSPAILIDKTLGVWIAFFQIWELNTLTVLTTLTLFTFLNYFKPFPLNIFYGFKKGRGIIADDCIAGTITNLIIRILLMKNIF